MAWTIAGQLTDAYGAHLVVLSEEEVLVGTKTLTWPPAGGLLPEAAGRPLEVLGVRVELTPTASAGNRRPKLQILDAADDVISEITCLSVVPASTAGVFEFQAGWAPVAAAVEAAGTLARCPLPNGLFLLPGQKLVVTQDAVIDAADLCVVHLRGRLRAKTSTHE